MQCMYVRTPLPCVCCVCFRSLQEELRSVEENKRQQIHLLQKQEEDCSKYFREKRAMEGRCRDLSKQKETISTETRVSLSCSAHRVSGVIGMYIRTYIHTYIPTYIHTHLSSFTRPHYIEELMSDCCIFVVTSATSYFVMHTYIKYNGSAHYTL